MLNFIVNNREVKTELPPGSSLVDFIRNELHLYGTKIGCREGDCGACTILCGELVDGQMVYQTMTSCLTPLGNAHNKHIVTIEGINQEELNLIQAEFVEKNGTQCGFCTPGFILSVYGFLLNEKEKTMNNAVEAIAGNICRCTGYKSIERAMESIIKKTQSISREDPVAWLIQNKLLPAYFSTIPEKMKKIVPANTQLSDDDAFIIAGGTDLLIQDHENAADALKVNLIFGAKSHQVIKFENGKCYIGAACSVTQIKESKELNKVLPKLNSYLELMASTPVRNMATVGGNIANGSPIGDLSVMLMGLDATLMLSKKGKKRELKLKDFFIGYKKVNKDPTEVIEWIYFDVPTEKHAFSFEKISKRIHLDMATVNSSLGIVRENGIVTKADFAVGGLGPTIRYLEKTSAYLVGKKLDNETFKEANRIAQSEITPRSRAEYKRTLVRQQLLIHLMSIAPQTVTLEAVK